MRVEAQGLISILTLHQGIRLQIRYDWNTVKTMYREQSQWKNHYQRSISDNLSQIYTHTASGHLSPRHCVVAVALSVSLQANFAWQCVCVCYVCARVCIDSRTPSVHVCKLLDPSVYIYACMHMCGVYVRQNV